MKLDRFTRAVLLIIAVLLGVLVFHPMLQPMPVWAQAQEGYPFYVEPGYTMLRKPDGSAQVYGKVVIDMRNGDIWGFPTLSASPYPVDTAQTKPPKSYPMYLGKFMFSEASH
ncbi:MAG TPA: hypothetical protein VL240_14535 [Candidatus Binatia bacterium]|nr:hypothetical protein [Candidatus Binatia bacterium]